jgi:hypothetical protein
MAGLDVRIYGVNFETVREALVSLYFKYDGITPAELENCRKFVLPMQHNFEQPIKPGSQDTWIQFWIDNDDRLTQDRNEKGINWTQKLSHITVRFLGDRAEAWAKTFHHLLGRATPNIIWDYYCNASTLEYITPIVPINVDYFGTGNTTIAFTLSFNLKYTEGLDFRPVKGEDTTPRLTYISLAEGNIESIAAALSEADGEAE